MDVKSVVPAEEQFTTHNGEVVTIHAVPNIILNGLKSTTPKPKRPKVEMTTKAGKQERFAKDGDPEWDAYTMALEEWKEGQSILESAVTKVLSLRSYPIGNTNILQIEASQLKFPDYFELMVSTGLIEVPDNPWLLKAMWLDTVVLTQQDEIDISWIIQKLNGVPEDLVEQMRSSFRDSIYGAAIKHLGPGDVKLNTPESPDNK